MHPELGRVMNHTESSRAEDVKQLEICPDCNAKQSN